MRKDSMGHDLDFLAKQYANISLIAIYGMGKLGNELKNILIQMQFENRYSVVYVDQNYKKEKDIKSPEWLLKYGDNNTLVVLAIANDDIRNRFSMILLKKGFSKNNICDINEFYNIILPIISVYYLDKIYLDSLQISVGDKCNLRCKDCTNFIPYMKETKNRTLDSLVEDVDALFKKIDYIRYMPIIGGETLLFEYLEDFVGYLLEAYSNQIGQLWVYTNGTLPDKLNGNLLDTLQKNSSKIHFFVSNYTHNNPKLTNQFKKFIERLGIEEISYTYIDNFIWNDTGVSEMRKREHTDLENFVSMCSQPCRDYENGKIYYCAIAKYAGKAFGIHDYKNEVEICKLSNKEIVEFVLGYIDSGFLEICKYCNGYDQFVNNRVVEAGIQINNL